MENETTATVEETVKETEETTTEEETVKTEETPEAKHSRLKRQLSQHEKKHDLTKEEKEVKKPKESKTKSTDLDYGQKAFLIASGVKGSEETALVQEIMESTGKSLEQVIDNKHFQAELKEMREEASVKEATPSGSKRSSSSAKDSVAYWIKKGELPPADQTQLRRDVVNARIKTETEGTQFSENPLGKV